MGSNSTENAKALCPFYKSAAKSSITCEGFASEIVKFIIIFTDGRRREEYSKNFCECKCYEGCVIYQTIIEKYI